jgi:hypothetical protein
MLFLQYTISTDDENRRIDRVLRKFLKDDLALSQIYKSLRNGEIRVNNKKVKQDYKTQKNDIIFINEKLIKSKNQENQNIQNEKNEKSKNYPKLEVIFENQYVKIINKPYNISVQKAQKDEIALDEIIKSQSPRGYFMTPYYFEPAELRLLIDAVQSADFISAKKTKSLIKKFSSFASEYQYKRIEKQVYIDNRNKCANENLFIVIDILSSAINSRKQVEVIYRKRKIVDGKTARYEEKTMIINPYALIWSDDHYYLVGNLHNQFLLNVHLNMPKQILFPRQQLVLSWNKIY